MCQPIRGNPSGFVLLPRSHLEHYCSGGACGFCYNSQYNWPEWVANGVRSVNHRLTIDTTAKRWEHSRRCRMADTVAVLGGGVGGLTAAHELAERGFSVHVYE
jgi:hypothetical protein